jgi:hypothetical protein
MSMAKVGNWMRNRETKELVKIIEIGTYVQYQNSDVDGEVLADRLEKDFEVLPEPNTQPEIETFIKTLIDAGEAEVGLYSVGVSYVVVGWFHGHLEFKWYTEAISFSDLTKPE